MKNTKKLMLTTLTALLAVSAFSGCFAREVEMTEKAGVTWSGLEWNGLREGEYPNRSSDIVQIGREYARTDSIPYDSLDNAINGAKNYQKELSPYIRYISRTEWKFNIVDSPSKFDESEFTEFYNPDFDVSGWDDLYVPSSWQNHGYDKPAYGARGGAFLGNFGNPSKKNSDGTYNLPLPVAPTVYNPVGLYRHNFTVPSDWDGSRIFINFEGVKSAFYLWINGIQVGYAEDSFTSDEFDITQYINAGSENTIAVKVFRWADSSWIEQQDMIDLSGIFRDVYIYATPKVRVRDYEIVTDFDKTFTDSTVSVDVDFVNYSSESENVTVKFRLFDAEGREVELTDNVIDKTLSSGEKSTSSLQISVASPQKWSAENPYLYTAVFEENMGGKTVYESYLTGFRKITYKTTESGWYEGSTNNFDLIRINGKPIMFRGVNRHDTHPTLGNAVPRETYLEDVRLMKENNINAVRTSHYPNDPYFLYLCDVYGIYVLEEANQEAHQWYDETNSGDDSMTEYLSDAIVDRQYNMVERDKNHSSIVMWSLGNESQSPTILKNILVNEYKTQEGVTRKLREYTKTRPWHYEPQQPGANGIDVGSNMYGSPEILEATVQNRTNPFIKCEYSHAMGNSLGNFNKFWNIFEKYKWAQGGFVWDFIDQTVVKYAVSNGNTYEYNSYGGDWGDNTSSGAFCGNGVVNADRTPKPGLSELKHQHREIKFEAVNLEEGIFEVKNFFLFRDIASDFDFKWELLQNDAVIETGTIDVSGISNTNAGDGSPGIMRVVIPYSFKDKELTPGSEYFLDIKVTYKNDEGIINKGHELSHEQFKLAYTAPGKPAVNRVSDFPNMIMTEENGLITFTGDGFVICFSKTEGKITEFKAENDSGVLVDLIANGEGPAGQFHRAATQNDKSEPELVAIARLIANHGPMTVSEVTVDNSNSKAVKIKVKGIYAKGVDGLAEETVYTVYSNGQIKIDAQFTPKYTSVLTLMPVVGMQMTLPEGFENIEFFGRGPYENYNDRCLGSQVGRYRTTVSDNYFDYLVPGETGNRVETRYVAITNSEGFGLLVSTNGTPFEFSALHYTSSALQGPRHLYQVPELAETILRVNAAQYGVGGDTCSAGGYIPDEEFLPKAASFSYSYTLSAISSNADPMLMSLTKNEEYPDTSYLQRTVEYAKSLSPEDYTGVSWQKLIVKTEKAEIIIATENPSADEIDSVQAGLDEAIANLVSVRELNTAVENIKTLNPDDYTYISYKVFYDAVAAAEKLKLRNPSESEIAAATDGIISAIEGLEALSGEDLTKPEGEINIFRLNFILVNAEKDETLEYTRLSEYLYGQKLSELKMIVNHPTSQEEVDAAITEARELDGILIVSTLETLGKKIDVTGSEFPKFDSGAAWGNNPNNTGDKVFDGSKDTYYDYAEANGGYTGVDLGEGNSHLVSGVKVYSRFCPNPLGAYDSRTLNAKIQGSNDKNTWNTLFTISPKANTDGVFYKFDNTQSYRYIRYLSPNSGFCNVAEVELYDSAPDTTLLKYAIDSAKTNGFSGNELEAAESLYSEVLRENDQDAVDEATDALLSAIRAELRKKLSLEILIERSPEDSFYNTSTYNSSATISLFKEDGSLLELLFEDSAVVSEKYGKTLLTFEIEAEEGNYLIVVEKPGYLSHSETIALNSDTPVISIELAGGDIKDSFNDTIGDGVVDVADFIRVIRGFDIGASASLRRVVDITEDQAVTIADIAIIKVNFGKKATG